MTSSSSSCRAAVEMRSTRSPSVRLMRVSCGMVEAVPIAVFVAVLGIVNTLVTAVLERRRELATLQAIGASRSQVERLVQWEAVYLGVIGAVLGVMSGLALAWVLIAVINKQSFGWTIRMTIPVEVLIQALLLAIGAAWIAGYFPARWAARQPVGEGLREE